MPPSTVTVFHPTPTPSLGKRERDDEDETDTQRRKREKAAERQRRKRQRDREAEEAALRQIERKQAEVPESKASSPGPTYMSSGPSTSLADVGLPPIVPGWNGFVQSLALVDKCLPPRSPGWRGSVPSLACVLSFRPSFHFQGFR